MSNVFSKFYALYESAMSEAHTRDGEDDGGRRATVARAMFNDDTVQLDALELPFDSSDPFLSFDVTNDIGEKPEVYLKDLLDEFRKIELIDNSGDFGMSDSIANHIDSMTSKIDRLGSEEKLTLSTYREYISTVIALLSDVGNTFEAWASANSAEIDDAIADSDSYDADPYGYYGHRRSDF